MAKLFADFSRKEDASLVQTVGKSIVHPKVRLSSWVIMIIENYFQLNWLTLLQLQQIETQEPSISRHL